MIVECLSVWERRLRWQYSSSMFPLVCFFLLGRLIIRRLEILCLVDFSLLHDTSKLVCSFSYFRKINQEGPSKTYMHYQGRKWTRLASCLYEEASLCYELITDDCWVFECLRTTSSLTILFFYVLSGLFLPAWKIVNQTTGKTLSRWLFPFTRYIKAYMFVFRFAKEQSRRTF